MTDQSLQADLAAPERTDPAAAGAARSYDLMMVEQMTGCPAPLDPIGESLLHLDVAVADLDEQLPRTLESGHPAARLLSDVDAAWRRLGALRSLLERTVVADLKPRAKPYDIDGVQVRVGGGSKWEWADHRQLAWRVAEGATVDLETGESLMDAADAWRLLDRLLTALPASPAWRVTALRELGVEYDDLGSRLDGRKTAAVVRAVTL
jgi:hypothetical protein